MSKLRPGRRMLGFAALITGLAIGGWMFQLLVLNSTVMPWYVPAMGAIAVAMAIAAFWQSPSIVRGLLTLLVVALGGMEVFFVLRGSLLPKYEGPVKVGSPFPAFVAEPAGGSAFTEADLRGKPTVLTFFRGRW